MARSKSLNGVFDRLTCPDEAQIMRKVRRIGRMNQVGYLTNIIVGRERPDEPVRTVQVVALVIQTRVDCVRNACDLGTDGYFRNWPKAAHALRLDLRLKRLPHHCSHNAPSSVLLVESLID